MSLASIANVPNDPATFAEWSFSHMAHHRDINRVILQQTRIALPEFSLDPFNVNDTGVWAYQHQQMHNDFNSVLGIAGNDLVDINFTDPGEFAEWIFLNFTEHYKAGNQLGV